MTKSDLPNYSDFKEGDTLKGKVISEILASSNDYLIYIIKGSSDVSFVTRGDCSTYLNEITCEFSFLSSYISNKERRRFRGSITQAHVQCFNGFIDDAKTIIKNIKDRVDDLRIIRSRLIYLAGFSLFLVVSFIVVYFLFIFESRVDNLTNFKIPELCLIAALGGLGGFISVSLRYNKLNIDPNTGITSYFISGVSRILFSMAAAVISYILIKSNIILGVLNNVENNFVYYIVAILSGFSETFIPNVFQKVEKDILK